MGDRRLINWQFLPSHGEYIQAHPWPHCVVDQFLSDPHVTLLNKHWPESQDKNWKKEKGKGSLKWGMAQGLPSVVEDVIKTLTSSYALECLSTLTGIPDLLTSDQATDGGGLHCIPHGGYLGVHVDYNQHKNGLYRRVNLLLYLNETWQPQWGGGLELHHNDYCKLVVPYGGRVVIFNTGEHSFHGHPEPLQCPPDRQRRSLALYYYTRTPPDDWTGARHSTIYRK